MIKRNIIPITIEELLINVESDFGTYGSARFYEAYHKFYKKLEKIEKEMNREDLIDSSDGGDLGNVLCRAERDYFKAGFRAGVRLLIESLGADI